MNGGMFILVALIALPAAFALCAPASAGWTASNSVMDVGQYQTLTASAGGGISPISYNVIVYGPIGERVYGYSQPDVLVMHSNGVLVGYNATVNTDQARGQALLGALANLSTGDSIYLEGETYNISTAPSGILLGGPSDAVTNVNLYGAGKYATKIVGNQNLNFDPGISSTVSDLSVYDMDYQQFTSQLRRRHN